MQADGRVDVVDAEQAHFFQLDRWLEEGEERVTWAVDLNPLRLDGEGGHFLACLPA